MKMFVFFKTIEGKLCLHKGIIPPRKKHIELNPLPINELICPIQHDGMWFYLDVDKTGNLLRQERIERGRV